MKIDKTPHRTSKKFTSGDFVFVDGFTEMGGKNIPFVILWQSKLGDYYITGDGSHYVSEEKLSLATGKDYEDYYGASALASVTRYANENRESFEAGGVAEAELAELDTKITKLSAAIQFIKGQARDKYTKMLQDLIAEKTAKLKAAEPTKAELKVEPTAAIDMDEMIRLEKIKKYKAAIDDSKNDDDDKKRWAEKIAILEKVEKRVEKAVEQVAVKVEKLEDKVDAAAAPKVVAPKAATPTPPKSKAAIKVRKPKAAKPKADAAKTASKARRATQRLSTADVDIEKDARLRAGRIGYRTSLAGNRYWEGRDNRTDIKQPPDNYPKLEKGGRVYGTGNYKNVSMDELAKMKEDGRLKDWGIKEYIYNKDKVRTGVQLKKRK